MPIYDGTITLACASTDVARSIQWFEETLGFRELFRTPDGTWGEVATSVEGVSIGLGTDRTPGGEGNTCPVIGVVDIGAARSELEGKGVAFDGPTIEVPGLVKLAPFKDPDGNNYMLAESLGGD